jgi:hypothetical protein
MPHGELVGAIRERVALTSPVDVYTFVASLAVKLGYLYLSSLAGSYLPDLDDEYELSKEKARIRKNIEDVQARQKKIMQRPYAVSESQQMQNFVRCFPCSSEGFD